MDEQIDIGSMGGASFGVTAEGARDFSANDFDLVSLVRGGPDELKRETERWNGAVEEYGGSIEAPACGHSEMACNSIIEGGKPCPVASTASSKHRQASKLASRRSRAGVAPISASCAHRSGSASLGAQYRSMDLPLAVTDTGEDAPPRDAGHQLDIVSLMRALKKVEQGGYDNGELSGADKATDLARFETGKSLGEPEAEEDVALEDTDGSPNQNGQIANRDCIQRSLPLGAAEVDQVKSENAQLQRQLVSMLEINRKIIEENQKLRSELERKAALCPTYWSPEPPPLRASTEMEVPRWRRQSGTSLQVSIPVTPLTVGRKNSFSDHISHAAGSVQLPVRKAGSLASPPPITKRYTPSSTMARTSPEVPRTVICSRGEPSASPFVKLERTLLAPVPADGRGSPHANSLLESVASPSSSLLASPRRRSNEVVIDPCAFGRIQRSTAYQGFEAQSKLGTCYVNPPAPGRMIVSMPGHSGMFDEQTMIRKAPSPSWICSPPVCIQQPPTNVQLVSYRLGTPRVQCRA